MTGTLVLANVNIAAQWLADQQEPPERVVSTLRTMFTLTTKEACEACALAADIRIERGGAT